MKRISIFGSYNDSSIGDTAILLGLLSALSRTHKYECLEVSVILFKDIDLDGELEKLNVKLKIRKIFVQKKSNNFVENILTKFNTIFFNKLSVNYKEIIEVFKSSDLLIIGGGNLVMDYFPSWVKIINIICDLAIQTKLKYIFLGVGAGPINTKFGIESLKLNLNNAEKVYFRDSYSKKYCEEKLNFYRSFVGPDLAFGINLQYQIEEKQDTLLVNVAALYSSKWPEKDKSKFNKYINNTVNLIIVLGNKYGFKKVCLLDTNYPLDSEASLRVIEKLKENNIIYEYLDTKKSVYDILKLCSSSNYALVTRLHAGILSSIGGCSIMAIAYQPKVRDVLKESGITDSVISIDRFLEDSFDYSSFDFNNKSEIISFNDVDELIKKVMN